MKNDPTQYCVQGRLAGMICREAIYGVHEAVSLIEAIHLDHGPYTLKMISPPLDTVRPDSHRPIRSNLSQTIARSTFLHPWSFLYGSLIPGA